MLLISVDGIVTRLITVRMYVDFKINMIGSVHMYL